MAKRKPITTIEIPPPPPSKGVRGRLEKLFIEYSTKAGALRMAADILDEHERRDAVDAFPKKLLTAAATRNGHHMNGTKSKSAAVIRGKVLSLFLLDSTADVVGQPALMEKLTAASGGPIAAGGRAITGPLAGLVRSGYMKRKGDAYTRTAAGEKQAATLREKLEAKGAIPKGAYVW